MSQASQRFSTGRKFLDQRINGGIPVGTALALTASAGSQSELLIREITRPRNVLYVSTLCPNEDELRSIVEHHRHHDSDISVEYATPEDLLDNPTTCTNQFPPSSFIVFDSLTGLEHADRTSYLNFLNAVKRRIRALDSIAIFHCPSMDATPPPRRTLTLNRSDHVWHLQTLLLSQDIKNRLYITKARGTNALTEPIPLILTDRVEIDTSRNI